jgi:pyruvate kinase
MINNPRPTRAEASDVANAIFDGTDAVMLSGETASGSYPLESVSMMNAIVLEAEHHFSEWGLSQKYPEEGTHDDAVSLTRAARELAHDRNVAAIAVFTQTGRTALLMSKARPRVPIMAFTPELSTYQRMGLYWGVTSFLVPFASNVESMVTHVEASLISSTSIQPGEQVVMISGLPVGAMRRPNFALLHTIGDVV